jgi:anti-sigma factor RsiW
MSSERISDEMLYAYVDNELDAAARAQVEAAMASDPVLAQRVEQQRSLRALLGAAYRPVLEEPVPASLQQAVAAPPPPARVVDLAAARAKKRRRVPSVSVPWNWKALDWKMWGGMAACLMIGLFAGRSAWFVDATSDLRARGGVWVASGGLAQALSTQLASAPDPNATVRVGLSFVARDNRYCRSFTVLESGAAGLACRRGDAWELRVLAQEPAAAGAAHPGAMRMAASTLSPALLQAIEATMQGTPLDAAAEREAASRGWQR